MTDTLSYRFDPAVVLPYVKAAASMSEDMVVRAEADGWHISTVSADHVMMADVRVHFGVFSDYSEGTFTVSSSDMTSALSRMPSDGPQSCTLTLSGGIMTVRGGGLTVRRTMLPDGNVPRVPSIEMPASAIVPSDPLRTLLSASSRDPKEAIVEVAVSDAGASLTCMDASDRSEACMERLELADVPCMGTGRAMYSMACVAAVLKVMPKGADVTMELGDDLPLAVRHEHDGSGAMMLIAPRIEVDRWSARYGAGGARRTCPARGACASGAVR